MLPIHRGNELTAVQLGGIKDRQDNIDCEVLLRNRHEWPSRDLPWVSLASCGSGSATFEAADTAHARSEVARFRPSLLQCEALPTRNTIVSSARSEASVLHVEIRHDTRFTRGLTLFVVLSCSLRWRADQGQNSILNESRMA